MALTYETRKTNKGNNGFNRLPRIETDTIIKKSNVKNTEFYSSLLKSCPDAVQAIKILEKASGSRIKDPELFMLALEKCKKEINRGYTLKVVDIAVKADVEDIEFYKTALDDCILEEDYIPAMKILSKVSALFKNDTALLEEEDSEIADEVQKPADLSAVQLYEHVFEKYVIDELNEEIVRLVDTAFNSKIEYIGFYDDVIDYLKNAKENRAAIKVRQYLKQIMALWKHKKPRKRSYKK